jgi:hypothetical protein
MKIQNLIIIEISNNIIISGHVFTFVASDKSQSYFVLTQDLVKAFSQIALILK